MNDESKLLWLAHSLVKANVDTLNSATEFCPWNRCDHLRPETDPFFGKFVAADGHYGVFDYLYKAVGLRSNYDGEGPLDDAYGEFEEAAFNFMNSDDEVGQFTFKPEYGGATYYFRKFEGEPSEVFASDPQKN